ncbi:MAG: hypothetical protein ACD_79C01534G0004, partial [uncultured bacterium]
MSYLEGDLKKIYNVIRRKNTNEKENIRKKRILSGITPSGDGNLHIG